MSLIYWESYLDHKAWELGINLQNAGKDDLVNLYRETLIEIDNTTTNISINRIELRFVEAIYKDLDSIIVGLNLLDYEKLETALILNRLIIARNILEIVIVLFDDVQNLDAVNRLVHRNQTFTNFRDALQSIVWNWRIKPNFQQTNSDRIRKLLSERSKSNSILDQLPKKNYQSTVASPIFDKISLSYQQIVNKKEDITSRLAGDPTVEAPPPPEKKKPRKTK